MTSLPLILTLALAAAPPPLERKGPCKDSLDVAIFVSPNYPNHRATMRINIASERTLDGAKLWTLNPKGELSELPTRALGGPPYGLIARIERPKVGRWRVGLFRGQEVLACQTVRVRPRGGRFAKVKPQVDPVWRPRIKWERDTENLYSIWIERLFDAPLDNQPSWSPLHEVLRDPKRNLLYNHLNLGEDGPRRETAIRLKPDCADFPYHLRAYFAWKMGLPFAYRRCRRGNARRAPTCSREYRTNLQPAQRELVSRAFQYFARREVGGSVHSSTARTLPTDSNSDFYPAAMTRHGIRPGTVFADPYGHILVVQRWVDQTADQPGILFAVDAQPDGTVGRRRFWRGSFLFPEDGAISGAGFKRFRPMRFSRRDQTISARSNAWISGSHDYGDLSLEQWENGKDQFYERMDALINPKPMKPETAFRAALDALQEQIERRALSVATGEAWKAKHPDRVIEMPDGPRIFQTAGPWEDFSTPSRDLRLLIAIQTVVDYPKRVVKFSQRFILRENSTPAEAQKRLEDHMMADAARRTFTYTRSDGSAWELTVADVINRRRQLEMAYNPNDCPEHRWGAEVGSRERAPCHAAAPIQQRKKMAGYRAWFAERRRPIW